MRALFLSCCATVIALAAAMLPAVAADDPALTVPGTRAEMMVDGLRRTYFLHLPTGQPAGERIPLVILLHGGGGACGEIYANTTGLAVKGDKAGFILVAPDSNGPGKKGWNAGMNREPEDIRFIHELIAHLVATANADPTRVYLVGFSAGALLAHRLGVELASELAGIAVIAGAFIWKLPVEDPTPARPARPVPAIVFHGEQDTNVPYVGFRNEKTVGWSAAQCVQFWVQRDGCTATPQVLTGPDGQYIRETYSGGQEGSEVIFYHFPGQGHIWPSLNKGGVSSTDTMWSFFQRFTRTPAAP